MFINGLNLKKYVLKASEYKNLKQYKVYRSKNLIGTYIN